MTKINVDGAVASHGHSGAVAAVCHARQGLYLGSSTVVFQGVTDPLNMETYAKRESLSQAEDLGIQRVVVASDRQGVVNDINQGTGGPHSAIIHEIIDRRASFQLFSFVHEHRNFNFEAHNLAKFDCNLAIGRHVWLGNPHDPTVVPMNITLIE